MRHGYGVQVSGSDGDCVDQLLGYLDDFDSPWFFYHHRRDEFTLCDVVLTPEVVALVVELLCYPLSPDSVRNQVEEIEKWDVVGLYNCSLTAPHVAPWRGVTNECPCTPDQVHDLFSLIASRAKKLLLSDCNDVVATWMSCPRCDPMILDKLSIYQTSQLSPLQLANLGDIIQKSPLQVLTISLQFDDAAPFLSGMDKAIYVRELSLLGGYPCNGGYRYQPVSSTLLSAVVNLLQNPLSQLQELLLVDLVMDDCQIATLAKALPASQLRRLQVPHKFTQLQGLLELAHQLPRIQNLKTVYLSIKDWKKSRETIINYQECCNAWVEGLKVNYSVKETDVSDLFQGMQHDLMEHYIRLNRAGKQILATSSPVPAGLWPLFLHRAMTRCEVMIQHHADTVFFFLKNCPIISGNLGYR